MAGAFLQLVFNEVVGDLEEVRDSEAGLDLAEDVSPMHGLPARLQQGAEILPRQARPTKFFK